MDEDNVQQNLSIDTSDQNEKSEPSEKKTRSRLAVSGAVLATLLGVQVALTGWISLDMKFFPQHWSTIEVQGSQQGQQASNSSSNSPAMSIFGAQAEALEKTTGDSPIATYTDKGSSRTQTVGQSLAASKETYSYSKPKDIRSWAAEKASESEDGEEDPADIPVVLSPEEITQAVYASLQAEKSMLLALPGDKSLLQFNAATQEVLPFEGPTSDAISRALEGFSSIGCDAGFILYDISAQQGFAYNVDQSFFAASTIKAPYINYALRRVSAGDASLDEEIYESRTMEGTGIMAYDDRVTYTLEEVLGNAIMHSDNTGYLLSQDRFGQEAFGNWAAETGSGLDANLYISAGGFPSASARMMAVLWNAIAEDVCSVPGLTNEKTTLGAAFNADSNLLLNWLNAADESFIRTALGDSAAVYSKTGYETPDYGDAALADCGLVIDEYGPYLLTFFSNAAFDDHYFRDNEGYAEALIAALADARLDLIVEQP